MTINDYGGYFREKLISILSPEERKLKCSFCGKTSDKVKKLIAGPNVFICDECVGLCNEILEEEAAKESTTNNNEEFKQSKNDIKINLSNCTKEDLIMHVGFDENKAVKFITERELGILYYDIDSFAHAYNLQPHEIVQIQDRLIFPLKHSVKKGRKIDF